VVHSVLILVRAAITSFSALAFRSTIEIKSRTVAAVAVISAITDRGSQLQILPLPPTSCVLRSADGREDRTRHVGLQ
jgi:hypothetical protein